MKPQKRVLLVFSIILLFALCSCGTDDQSSSLPDNSKKVTIHQGVWGNVRFWAGDHMPGLDDSSTGGTITPVVRDLYIYQPTTRLDAQPSDTGIFFSSVDTQLVAVVQSDETGFYQAELPVGTYSVLVLENGLLYAGFVGGDGTFNPVTITADSVTKLQIDITYAATF